MTRLHSPLRRPAKAAVVLLIFLAAAAALFELGTGLGSLKAAALPAKSASAAGNSSLMGAYTRSLTFGTYDKELTYTATLAITNSEKTTRVEILKARDMVRYTVETEGGKGFVVVRGSQRGGYGAIPKGLFRQMGQTIPERPDLVAENYEMRQSGREILLGRPVTVLEVVPRNSGRPHRTVWVDDATGIALRIRDLGPSGGLIQEQVFEALDLSPSISSQEIAAMEKALSQESDHHGPPPLLTPEEASQRLRWKLVLPSYVPSGYQLVGVRLPRDQEGVAHILYHDGLGLISLYERLVPWWARRSKRPEAGEFIDWESRGIHYTLVGDASSGELLDMAKSTK